LESKAIDQPTKNRHRCHPPAIPFFVGLMVVNHRCVEPTSLTILTGCVDGVDAPS
jgi:hypothetical protein